MGKSDYSEFEKKVDRALRHADYPELQRKIKEAARAGDYEEVGRTVGEIGRAVGGTVRDIAHGVGESFGDGQKDPVRPVRKKYESPYDGVPMKDPVRHAGRPAGRRAAFRSAMPGSVGGLVCAVFGFAFGIPLAVASAIVGAVGAAGALSAFTAGTALAVLLPFTGAALALAGWGISLRRRARRFARYLDALDGATFGTVEQLAAAAGQPVERTKKDLRKMISSGACPQGHLDRTETYFLADNETYETYLEAEKSYEAREEAARRAKEAEQADPRRAALDAVRQEGAEYLRQIRAVNDALPGKVISDKLDRLENVSSRIFQCVEQHPGKLPEIRRLMRYYLPTVLKLTNAYREFESQPVQGENIAKAKAEIESALDTVNVAFETLLDSLYADDALDVSSDISALEAMLKQEGLTGSDFRKQTDAGPAAAPPDEK